MDINKLMQQAQAMQKQLEKATEQINATEFEGVASNGLVKVTVNGETFYTFFNCAPLLYNTKTTRLIKSEYYWYKNQWDKRDGMSHENSAGDCASKAATWGVFESIATRERYIVISTHMCTRSDYIRGLQGQEMVDLIEQLHILIRNSGFPAVRTFADIVIFIRQPDMQIIHRPVLPGIPHHQFRKGIHRPGVGEAEIGIGRDAHVKLPFSIDLRCHGLLFRSQMLIGGIP